MTCKYYECTGISSVIIPNSVTSINFCAFAGCTGLTSIIIPNSVTKIESYAFSGCSALSSITIPNNLYNIESNLFENCTSLTAINIPDGVAYISSYSFRNCSKLSRIIIGSGIHKIGFSAFALCPEITDVYCYANYVPETSSDAFDGSFIEYANLHVPEELISEYSTKIPWKYFKNSVALTENDPTFIRNMAIDSQSYINSIFYDTNGVRLQKTNKGINIINGKKVIIK